MKKYILATAICLGMSNMAHATAPVFDVSTIPSFIGMAIEAIVQETIIEDTESTTLDQLMAWGLPGPGAEGAAGSTDSETGASENESSTEGVLMAQALPSLTDEKTGLTANVLKSNDLSEPVKVLQEKIQMPTPEQRKKLTVADVDEKRAAIKRIQTSAAQDGLAVGLANSQISSESGCRGDAATGLLKESKDLRGDIQARSQAALQALGEVNRLVSISSKTLGVLSSGSLSDVQSSSAASMDK